MEKEEKNIENHDRSTWVKTHKKGIIIIIVAVGVGYVVYRNWDSIIAIFKSINPESIAIENPEQFVKAEMLVADVIPEISTKPVNRIINNGKAFGVREHLRNLPNGWNASAAKIDLASHYGIKLSRHQTLVNNYLKNYT